MNNLFIKELQIDSTLDYKVLFSNTKSSALDRNLNALLKYGVAKGEIKVKKYLLAENIANELFELGEWKVKSHKKIKELLKDWHMESDASLIPILFILEKLESNFKVEPDAETKIFSIQSNRNIRIGHRFSSEDAFARIYFPDDKTIVNLTSDSLINLINCLVLENIKIYLLDMEWVGGEASKIVAYELISTEKFRHVRKELEEKLISEIMD